MQVEFQAMNPSKTDDSFLLRINDSLEPVTQCFLVDCGNGVNVDKFLTEKDELSGIIITHAHEDHISALPENTRKNVPIYTTPDTAIVLKKLFKQAAAQSNSSTTFSSNNSWDFWDRITPTVAETVTQQLTPIEEITQLTPSVDLIPLPAGHTIGAGSFLFKTYTGTKEHHFLATGDFTPHAVGQTPGLDKNVAQVADIDVLFMNTAMRTQENSYKDVFTDSIKTILEEAAQGKKVLVSSSSLTSIHYANWLQKSVQKYSTKINVILAGLSATMYDELGYDTSNLELAPTYEDNTITKNGTIVISAPEVPSSGGSGRIYDQLKNDPNSSIIQIKSGGDVSTEQLSIDHSYRHVPHPTQDELDSLVEFTNPVHTVLNHGPKKHYKNKYSFTIHWTVMNHHKRNLLLDNGTLCNPPWVNDAYASDIKSENITRERMMVAPTGLNSIKPLTDPETTFEKVRLDTDRLTPVLEPRYISPEPTQELSHDSQPTPRTTNDYPPETTTNNNPASPETTESESTPQTLSSPKTTTLLTQQPEVLSAEEPSTTSTNTPQDEPPITENASFNSTLKHLQAAQELLETETVTAIVTDTHSDGSVTLQFSEETVGSFEHGDKVTLIDTK